MNIIYPTFTLRFPWAAGTLWTKADCQFTKLAVCRIQAHRRYLHYLHKVLRKGGIEMNIWVYFVAILAGYALIGLALIVTPLPGGLATILLIVGTIIVIFFALVIVFVALKALFGRHSRGC